jgi:hypothetical protein
MFSASRPNPNLEDQDFISGLTHLGRLVSLRLRSLSYPWFSVGVFLPLAKCSSLKAPDTGPSPCSHLLHSELLPQRTQELHKDAGGSDLLAELVSQEGISQYLESHVLESACLHGTHVSFLPHICSLGP